MQIAELIKRPLFFLLMTLLTVHLISAYLYVFYFGVPFPLKKITCLKVLDGDTLIVREWSGENNSGPFSLRLTSIDAPELKQLSLDGKPVGVWAKNTLEQLVLGKTLLLQERRKDLYGRTLGEIWPFPKEGHAAVTLTLIQKGMAILYPFSRFSSPQEKRLYVQSFLQAFKKRKGIWSTLGLLSPYHYRKNRKTKNLK